LEGDIATNNRKGFTLVEMTVVMAIIAVLMLLGAGGLLSARDQFTVDRAVEEAITAVREAQNRSISFMQGTPGTSGATTKVWGVDFSDNTIKIISVDGEGTNHLEKTAEINPGITITAEGGNHIYFASPFATTYLCQNEATIWSQSTDNPSKEYEPSDCLAATGDINLLIEYKDHTRSVTINQRGDANAN